MLITAMVYAIALLTMATTCILSMVALFDWITARSLDDVWRAVFFTALAALFVTTWLAPMPISIIALGVGVLTCIALQVRRLVNVKEKSGGYGNKRIGD